MKSFAAAVVVTALTLAAATARAESSDAGRPPSVSSDESGAERVEPGVRNSAELGEVRGARPLAAEGLTEGLTTEGLTEGLTDDELRVLEEMSAENPELADQSGGYVSNDELVTILLVVLIVLIIL